MRRYLLVLVSVLGVACGSSPVSQPGGPSTPPTATTPPPTESGAVAVLALDGTPGHGVAPDTERFDGSASYSKDANAQLTGLQWDFGDGSEPASGEKVAHTFASPGSYVVTLTVTDSDGSTGTASLPIEVSRPDTLSPEMIAIAKFDGTDGHGAAPDLERFDGTGSHPADAGATLAQCHWDFGDGAHADGCKAEHAFATEGDFTVKLTATGSDGSTGEATLGVHVDPPPPTGVVAIAAFDGTSGHGVAPDTERFDGSASHARAPGATLASCAWSFGDGASSIDCKTSHTFAKPGRYTVTLTAKDSAGSFAQATLTVRVDAPPKGSIRWQKSVAGNEAHVGSDFGNQVAVTYGSTLAMLDPETGGNLWSHDYALPPDSSYRFHFRGPVFIGPGSHRIYTEDAVDGGYAPSGDVCWYESSGARICFGGNLEDEGLVLPISMSAVGEVAWGFTGFPGQRGSLLRADLSQWTVSFIKPEDSVEAVTVGDTAAEPGGDLVIALFVRQVGFTFDGQTLPTGHVLMRVNPEGHLVWWEPIPFEVQDLGTSAAGTIVAVVSSDAPFTWGTQQASGTALVAAEQDGTPRWVRPLPSGVSAQVSVLPAGRVALILGRPYCGGWLVYRFDLSGNEEWHRDFGEYACDVELEAVSIRPGDVLVSGSLAGTTDFGDGPLPPGGFVLDLNG